MKKLLFTLSLLLLPLLASADCVEIDGIYYNLIFNTQTATVTSNPFKYVKAVVIPESVEYGGKKYRVTSINSNAFSGCSGLTSITIPNSVTSIGQSAFYECSGLTSVTIPNSVTSISKSAFKDCSGLTSVTIPNSVTSIGQSAFEFCSGLTSITFPKSVTYIGDRAFQGCLNLTSVTIPKSLTSIGKCAFDACPEVTSIIVENGNSRYDSRNNCNAIIETSSNALILGCKNTIIPYNVTSIGEYAFSNCTRITSITIPNSVISINESAFHNCANLTSVSIPNSVTSIGNNAFDYCKGLLSVIIQNGVTSIGNNAFYGCSGLTSVTIPNSVTSIGQSAFRSCSGLNSIVVESGNSKYDSRNNCNAIIETSSNNIIIGCKNTIIPSNVTTIGEFAFSGCRGLTSLTIPTSVTSIGQYAFSDCTGLTSLIIPNGVTSIGNYAFYNCGLTSVTIPNSVTYIDYMAFSWCDHLTSVSIGSGVKNIGYYAFGWCSSLTSVTIGIGVVNIGLEAFVECKQLQDIYCLAENVPNTSTDAFKDSNPENTTLHVPAESINAYKTTKPWSNFGKIVSLEGGETPETKKCAMPTISYQFGQLSFNCETEDVTFISEITDYDIKKSNDATLYLTATYYISVYATKEGYEDSDVATATLSWMDAELETDISGGVANVRAKPVLIQSNGNTLSISGIDEGTPISIYDISGKMVGSAKAASENTIISTSLNPGDVGLVKIGDKTIKIIVK